MPVIGFLQRGDPIRGDFGAFESGLHALGYARRGDRIEAARLRLLTAGSGNERDISTQGCACLLSGKADMLAIIA
jgi:hypothetical protein